MSMVQYGLWPNCTNKCDFCLLDDRQYKTVTERLNVLDLVKENIQIVDWQEKFKDGISLLGGEVFYTDSNKVKDSFLDLINLIIKHILKKQKTTKLSVVSNGIYDPEILLIPILDILKEEGVLNRFDLNFSWDFKHRFHTKESESQMIANANLVYDKYKLIPGVQSCLTQALINATLNGEFNIFKYKEEHFPNTVLSFLYPHKIKTGIELDDFFFTRASLFKFINWMKVNSHDFELMNFISSVINSSQFKYTGLFDRRDIHNWKKTNNARIQQEPTLERKQILAECGHSQLYRCYSDSNKCMLCDLLKVL